MITGVSVSEEYEGPAIGAAEFRLWDGNLAGTRRKEVLSRLLERIPVVSAHLPSFLLAESVEREVAFDSDGLVHHFVAHVTKHSSPSDWKGAWRRYAECGKRILFENHNQDWHPTDEGMCWPDQFKPIADAGHQLCLDTGHILYASMFKARDASEWVDIAQRTFEGFLELPIAAMHAHTVDRFGGVDHCLEGFDVGPWIRRVAERNPGVVVLAEIMDPAVTVDRKVDVLSRWVRG